MTDAAKLNPTEREQSDSLRKAYSGEKAASVAYIGHAGSLRDPKKKPRFSRLSRTNGITAGMC